MRSETELNSHPMQATVPRLIRPPAEGLIALVRGKMKRAKALRNLADVLLIAVEIAAGVVSARPESISGPINTTRFITENSELVGDVSCALVAAPCIQFRASGITLKMNGFTMTGLADAATGCNGNSTNGEAGINTAGQSDITIQGPGLVQRFRAVGINGNGSNRMRVVNVTVATNCLSGILIANSAESQLEGNVAVRNGQNSGATGGIYILNAHRNRIMGNHVGGNGYIDQANVPPNDFGIGLTDGSSENLVEGNTVVSNANGIFIGSTTVGNIVRSNVVIGNPSIQVSSSFPQNSAVDIRNGAPASANTFSNNLCITSINAPCPNVPTVPDLRPTVISMTIAPATIPAGGSFDVTFSGNNLTNATYFDVRVRPPGGNADEVVLNWQQGGSAKHEVPKSTSIGNWTITRVRPHEDANDHSGAFGSILGTISIFFSPFF
jgi:parallel beta-helix repeat protein